MKKKIISCTGYGGTGSSAISDLIKEFSNCISMGDHEFWFLQGYNGISDLEYYLIDGNHRSKVSLAIHRFKKYVNQHAKFYETFFGNKYKKLSEQYISSLIDAEFNKALSSYELENSFIHFLVFKISPLFQKILWKINWFNKNPFTPNVPRVRKYYSIPDKSRFYKITKKYTTDLFNCIDKEDKKEFILLDQLVPSINTQRYFNYVDNLKVIIVDRDPRDLYLSNELIWKGAAFICDTSNLVEFINWYKTIRNHQKIESNHKDILHIRFEELIHNYDKTLKIICDFLDLDQQKHFHKKMFFNPEMSKKNTRIWKTDYANKYKNEIKLIENHLSEYCL